MSHTETDVGEIMTCNSFFRKTDFIIMATCSKTLVLFIRPDKVSNMYVVQ